MSLLATIYTTSRGLLLSSRLLLVFIVLWGCGDIKLMREAARNTTEMNEKMDTTNQTTAQMNEQMATMLEQIVTTNSTTAAMNEKMDHMLSQVNTMSNQVALMGSMNEQMSAMTDNMTEMKTIMLDMNDYVEYMHSLFKLTHKQGRQVGASLSRSVAWQNLTNPGHKIEAKLTQAAIYYYSFEYQSALLDELNNHTFMAYLLYEGVREYLRTIEPLIRKADGNLAINSKDSTRNALYALSAALHEYNPLQTEYNPQPITMEQLLKHGLLTYKLNQSNAAPFSKEVHSWIPSVEYLLQLRHNFITGVIVQKISTLNQDAQYTTFNVDELANMAQKALFSWEIDYANVVSHPGLLVELTKFANLSNDLRQFLFCYFDDDRPIEISFGLTAIMEKLNLDPLPDVITAAGQPDDIALPFISAMQNLKQSIAGELFDRTSCSSTQQMLDELDIDYH